MCDKNLSTNHNFREGSNLNIHLKDVHLKISSFEFYSILIYQFILIMITYFWNYIKAIFYEKNSIIVYRIIFVIERNKIQKDTLRYWRIVVHNSTKKYQWYIVRFGIANIYCNRSKLDDQTRGQKIQCFLQKHFISYFRFIFTREIIFHPVFTTYSLCHIPNYPVAFWIKRCPKMVVI